MIDIAIKSVKKYQNRKLRKQIAFYTDDVTLDQYWEKLTDHLSQPDSAIIISLSGRIKHWTCVRKITPNALILSDSSGIRRIVRDRCTIETESRDMYTLWPTLTYFLLIREKTKSHPGLAGDFVNALLLNKVCSNQAVFPAYAVKIRSGNLHKQENTGKVVI